MFVFDEETKRYMIVFFQFPRGLTISVDNYDSMQFTTAFQFPRGLTERVAE